MITVAMNPQCLDGKDRPVVRVVHWANGVGMTPALCGLTPGSLRRFGFDHARANVTCRGCLAQERRDLIETHRGKDCAWCGGELGVELATMYANRALEVFCSANHRRASDAARDRLLRRQR